MASASGDAVHKLGETFFPDFSSDLMSEDYRKDAYPKSGGRKTEAMTDEDLFMDPSLSSGTARSGELCEIMCPLCQRMIKPNPANMCIECLNAQVDISEGVSKELILFQCRNCERWYDNPRYVEAALESSVLLGVCLKRVRGLGKKVRLVDAKWIWTEPHSRRLEVEVTIQKEVFHGAIVQKKFPIEFIMENQQCEECQASFTHHTWTASVQVRQKVKHKRTFLFLEQLILKHGMSSRCIGVTEERDGIDFFFASKSHANSFVGFLHSLVPIESRQSRRLISHDTKSNVFKFKYTIFVEIASICRLDLVLVPPEIRRKLGGKSPLVLCYKVTDKVHFVEPSTLHAIEFDSAQFFRKPFRAVAHSSQCTRFYVMACEPLIPDSSVGRWSDGASVFGGSVKSGVGSVYSAGSKRRRKSKAAVRKRKRFETLDGAKGGSPQQEMGARDLDTMSVASGRSRFSAMSRLSTTSTVRSTIGKSSGSHKFKLCELELVKECELGATDAKLYRTRTHLGGVLKEGDLVEAYDLDALGVLDADAGGYEAADGTSAAGSLTLADALRKMKSVDFVPDVVVTRKHYERSAKHWKRRKWKLKQLKKKERGYEPTKREERVEAEEREDFLRDLEEQFEMRCRINIFKKNATELDALSCVASTVGHDVDRPKIGLKEMLDDLEDLTLAEEPAAAKAAAGIDGAALS